MGIDQLFFEQEFEDILNIINFESYRNLMGPKKQIKKQVVQQPPKQVQPEIPPHELQGYGRFTYATGSQYEGEWRLIRGIKSKHGKGVLTVQNAPQSQIGKQIYEGQWFQDKMHGYGTYYFPDGSVYKGNWKNNEFSGQGIYEFPNGTIYQGQWENHSMHGTGFFVDHNGRKWGGEYRKGKFQTRNQAELVKEKAITLKKVEIKKQVELTLQSLLEAVAKSDKKTLKDNLAPFFATADNVKEFIKQPYAKFDERPPEKWTEVLTIAKTGNFKVLQNQSQATVITPDRILGKQLEGVGQFVEVVGTKQQKTIKLGLVGLENKKWIIISAIQQQKKK